MNDPAEIPVPSTERTGQATRIEQARAMAEVHAAMAIARDHPRSSTLARQRMTDACSHPSLANRAFFKFPRSDGTVTGPSIHLARELARCWTNVDFGIRELYRNDLERQSEMQAWAWDLETNVRPTLGFIVPHTRDIAAGKTSALTSMRDIYENNANAGARRLRECIFAVLPLWFREEAQRLCRETMALGKDEQGKIVPFEVRKAKAIEWFEGKGIRLPALEDKLGTLENQWRPIDLATLTIIYQSIEANETTLEMEFPTAFTRGQDIVERVPDDTKTRPGPAPAVKVEQWQPPEPEPAADPEGQPPPMDTPPDPNVPEDYVCDVCLTKGHHFQDDTDKCPGPPNG